MFRLQRKVNSSNLLLPNDVKKKNFIKKMIFFNNSLNMPLVNTNQLGGSSLSQAESLLFAKEILLVLDPNLSSSMHLIIIQSITVFHLLRTSGCYTKHRGGGFI